MIDILAFTALLALVALAAYLLWPPVPVSPVLVTRNKDRKFGADPCYYRIDALDLNGETTTFLFTEEQLNLAAERAIWNPEDL